MAEIMCRHAPTRFSALMTAQGMEDANCYAFSITHVPNARPTPSWVVWGRFHSTETTYEEIDRCIQKRLFPTSEGGFNDQPIS
jgi:hypothetical protein